MCVASRGRSATAELLVSSVLGEPGVRDTTAAVASSTPSIPRTRLPSTTSAMLEYQPTTERFPVALLWLPYAALTLLLSALLVASFVHFHCKNGHKYRKRRSTNGNGDETGSTSVSVVRHVAFSDDQTSTPGVAVIDCASAVACFRYTSPPIGRQRQQVPMVGWGDDHDRQPRKCNGDIGDIGVERTKIQHQVRRACIFNTSLNSAECYAAFTPDMYLGRATLSGYKGIHVAIDVKNVQIKIKKR